MKMNFHRSFRNRAHTGPSRGISMVEILIAIAVFTLSIATLGTMGFSGMQMLQDANTRYRANLFAEEGLAALRNIREFNPSALVPGTYGLVFSNGVWSLSPVPDTDDNITREVTITAIAPGRMLAKIAVSWERAGVVTTNTEGTAYLDIFSSAAWTETSNVDFTAGKMQGTEVLSVGDGAVGLELRKDWGKPKEFTSHDIAGAGAVTSMVEAGGMLYVASWGASGTTLDALDISAAGSGIISPAQSITRTERINAIAISGHHIFIGTDGDSSELIALRRSDLSVARTVDLIGGSDILSLAATGTTLYAGRGTSVNPELYEFNVADPEAGITQVRATDYSKSITALTISPLYVFLGGTAASSDIATLGRSDFGVIDTMNLTGAPGATALVLDRNTLYAGRGGSAATEIVRIDASDPVGGLTVSGGADTAAGVTSLHMGHDNRLYAATAAANAELVIVEPDTFAMTAIDVQSGAGAGALSAIGGYIYVGLQNSNPEVVALRGGDGQWENPGIAGSYDAPTNSDGLTVFVSGTTAYLGTQSSSGRELAILGTGDPMLPQLLGSFEVGANVNGIAMGAGNIVLATSNNSSELRIVNASNPSSPVSVGLYNTPGNQDGLSVAASGTMIALGTENNTSGREIFLFNISNPSAPVLSMSQEVGAGVRGLTFTAGGYLVAATENDAKEFIVYDPRVPGLPEVSSYNTTGASDGLSAQATGDTVSLTTQNSGVNPDFYIFTISPTSGAITLRGSLDLAANATDAFTNGDLTYVSTNNTNTAVMVLDTSNITSPRILSSVPFGATAYGIAGDDTRIYVATGDNTREFTMVVPGAPLVEYVHRGWFTSPPFDSGSGSTYWGALSWTTSGTGTVAFQVRTAATQSGLSTALWVGAGGVVDDLYTITGSSVTTDPLANGTEWVQLRAMLVGDGVTMPILEDVTITYN